MDATVRALMALARTKVATSQNQGDAGRRAERALLVAALSIWFGSQPAIAATELPDALIAQLVAYGFTHRAAVTAGELASYPPLTGRTRHGAPKPKDDPTTVRRVASEEPNMRAEFVIASAERLTQAEADGRFDAQLEDEQRYRDMHVAMGRRRRWAARRLDEAAAKSDSGWLVWRCASHPEAMCAALRGRIFHADTPPGLPGAMHLNCLLPGTVVSTPGLRATTMRWYSGEVVELLTSNGDYLAVTPNHPILTPQGWVAAGLLDEGSQVIRTGFPETLVGLVDPDDYEGPALIEDVVASFGERRGVLARAVPVAAEDFHGDGSGSEIAVVRADSELWNRLNSPQAQPGCVQEFSGERSGHSMPSLRGDTPLFPRVLHSTDGGMRGFGVAPVLLGGAGAHRESVGLSASASGYSTSAKHFHDYGARRTVGASQFLLADSSLVGVANIAARQVFGENPRELPSGASQTVSGGLITVGSAALEMPYQVPAGNAASLGRGIGSDVASFVMTDRLKKVRRYLRWSGHVYNLETSTGWYVSGNILTHNCKCMGGTVGRPDPY